MSGTTPNLDLVKPGENGTADIKVIDQNMQKIDEWAGEKETELSGKEPKFNKKTGFNLDKTDSTTTNSSIILATAKAIKTVWDKVVGTLAETVTNKNAIQNNKEQIETLIVYEDFTVLTNQFLSNPGLFAYDGAVGVTKPGYYTISATPLDTSLLGNETASLYINGTSARAGGISSVDRGATVNVLVRVVYLKL